MLQDQQVRRLVLFQYFLAEFYYVQHLGTKYSHVHCNDDFKKRRIVLRVKSGGVVPMARAGSV